MLFLSRSSTTKGSEAKVDLRTVLPALNGSWWINKTLWLEKETELCWIYLPPPTQDAGSSPPGWLDILSFICQLLGGGGRTPPKTNMSLQKRANSKGNVSFQPLFLDDILPLVGSLLPELQGDTHTHTHTKYLKSTNSSKNESLSKSISLEIYPLVN